MSSTAQLPPSVPANGPQAISLSRSVIAIVAVSLLAEAGSRIVDVLVQYPLIEWVPAPVRFPVLMSAIHLVTLGFVIITWLVLRFFRTRATSGEPVWYQTMTTSQIAALAVGLAVVVSLMPNVGWDGSVFEGHDRSNPAFYGAMAIAWGVAGIWCIVWLWWCDQQGGDISILIKTAASWAAFRIAVQFAAMTLPGTHVFFTRDPDLLPRQGFFNAPGFSTAFSFSPNWRLNFEGFGYIDGVALANMFGAPIVIAGVSVAIYASYRVSTSAGESTPTQ